MNATPPVILTARPSNRLAIVRLALLSAALLPQSAHASLFHGETLDAIANGISWVVLVIAPIIGIAAFWLVHILPEKIAEKKKHPQTHALQCLCLLSLCFGGLLWPLAWLWAYTKPVLQKMAYGTDADEAAFDQVVAVNLKGVFLAMKYEIQHMLKAGGGAIVNNASIAGMIAAPGISAYVAATHAVIGLTKAAAIEYAAQNPHQRARARIGGDGHDQALVRRR